MPLRAGRLRDRITIRRGTMVKNAATGGQTRGWSTVAELWAEAISQGGREALIESSLQGIVSYKFTIRRRTDLTAGDQVLFGGREFNIRSVADDPFAPQEATVIFADTESPQGAAI